MIVTQQAFLEKLDEGHDEHCGVVGRVDIITSTLGKALGGAMGVLLLVKKKLLIY